MNLLYASSLALDSGPSPCASRLAVWSIAALSGLLPAAMISATAMAAAWKPLATAAMADVVDQQTAFARLHPVKQRARLLRELGAYRALSPRTRLARDDGEQRERIRRRIGAAPPPALQRDDRLAVHGTQLDPQGPHAGHETHGMPFRAREVAVRVDRDRSGPVGLHATPVARVEHGRRKREHVVEIRLEQVTDRHALAVVVAAREPVAAFQPRVGEPVPPLRGRRRHHQVAAQEADRVLRASLLPTGIGVVEPRLEAVMRAEQREQPRLGDGPVDPAVADPGGVVEHQHAGNHASMGEHPVQSMAHAFRGLSRQRGHVPHVRIRERDHQEMHGPFHARDHGQGLAEIDLRAAWRPFQLAEPLGLAPVSLPPPLDPTLHRRVAAFETAFIHEPLVHAPGGVPLLARHTQVGLEPFVGLARVLADDQ